MGHKLSLQNTCGLILALAILTPGLCLAQPEALRKGLQIRDEGTGLSRRNFLNFIGAGVTCTDDTTDNETECDISAGSGDVTAVGDCTTGACFGGASGKILTFEGITSDNETFGFVDATDDFEMTNDLNLYDVEPHLSFYDTTTGEDDFHFYADASQFYLTNLTDTVELFRFDASYNFFFRGGGTTYSWPTTDGTNGQFLTTNGSGVLTWTTSSGSGDITSVGNVASGAAFDGTQGTTLTFEGDGGTNFTLIYDTVDDDFELSDDLTIEDVTPHLRLTDTTASEDDFEWYAETSKVYLTDVTNGNVLAYFSGDGRSHVTLQNNLSDRTSGVYFDGTLTTSLGVENARPRIPSNCTVQRVDGAVTTAPQGSAITVDVLECTDPGTCTTILPTGGGACSAGSVNCLNIAANSISGSISSFSDNVLSAGNYLQFNINQIGSSTAGSNLTVTLICRF